MYGAGHAKASQATEDLQMQDPPLAGLRLAVAAHEIPHPAKARSSTAVYRIPCRLSVVMRNAILYRLRMVAKMLSLSVSKEALPLA
jgi:hypothetical protein